MTTLYQPKIDAYSHIAPQKYRERLRQLNPQECAYKIDPFPPLYDLDHRFRIMDEYQAGTGDRPGLACG